MKPVKMVIQPHSKLNPILPSQTFCNKSGESRQASEWPEMNEQSSAPSQICTVLAA